MSSAQDPSDEDVKALLGRALADEPPLALDRDEVFRRGRRKLRNRLLFSSGGVIAGVVMVAVGAVVLTGLLADEREQEPPPAATQAGPDQHAPPGPTLPLTPSVDPPSSESSTSGRHADVLTNALFGSGLIPREVRLSGIDGKAVFRSAGDTYELRTDVVSPTDEGSLFVSVGAVDSKAATDCKRLDVSDCETRVVGTTSVVVGKWKDHDTGEKRYEVFAIHPDGTSVTAVSTNLSDRQRVDGARPPDGIPIIDDDVLTKIVTIPDLRFAS